jgi:ribosome-binding protein aMBF1 (putative translation factor)
MARLSTLSNNRTSLFVSRRVPGAALKVCRNCSRFSQIAVTLSGSNSRKIFQNVDFESF